MFKDLWKKFGVKAMIIVCSVLLLGGVAIAAPRLRADTLPTLTELDAMGDFYVDPVLNGLEYNGEEQIPRYIRWDPDPNNPNVSTASSITLERGVDFVLSRDDGINAVNASDAVNGNQPYIYIDASCPGSTQVNQNHDKIRVEYDIPKHSLGVNAYLDISVRNPEDQNQDYIVVGTTLTKNYVLAYIKYRDGSSDPVRIDPGDFELYDEIAGNKITSLGVAFNSTNTFSINLTNYKKNGISYFPGTCKVKKDIEALEVDNVNPTTETFTVEDTELNQIYQSSQLGSIGISFEFANPTDGKLTISADPNSTLYTGTKVVDYVSTRIPIAGAVADSSFPSYIDYDTNEDPWTHQLGSYRQVPQTISGGTLRYGRDFTVDDPDTAFAVDGRLADGAAVGQVQLRLTGINRYTGTAGVTYNVGRNINRLSPKWEDGTTTTHVTYSGSSQRPNIVLTDGDYELVENTDFVVSEYRHELGNNVTTASALGTRVTTDVGTVYVKISGLGGGTNNQAGYYDTYAEDLEYYIDQMPISDSDYLLSFNGRPEGAGAEGSFSYTGNLQDIRAEIRSRAAICYSIGEHSRWKYIRDLTQSTDYTLSFPDETQSGPGSSAQPGTHSVVINFHGNYTGSITAQYRVNADRVDTSTIDITPGYVFDGTPKPVNITLYADGNPNQTLPSSIYTIEYQDASGNWSTTAPTNAGTVYFRVKSRVRDDDVKTYADSAGTDGEDRLHYTIEPRDLDNASGGAITLESSYPFAGHSYTAYPDVQSVEWASLGNGYTLTEGTDYTIECISSQRNDGSYNDLDSETKVADHGYPRINEVRYALKLTGRGNFTGAVYTSLFKFTPKTISSSAIEVNCVSPVPYVSGRSNADYVTDAAFTVYDSDLQENLRFRQGTSTTPQDKAKQDYTITTTGSGISGEITVTVTGQNAYTGTRTKKIKVGRSLTDANIHLYKGDTEITRRRMNAGNAGDYIYGVNGDGGSILSDRCAVTSSGHLVMGYSPSGMHLEYYEGDNRNNNGTVLQYGTHFTVETDPDEFFYENGDLNGTRFQCVTFKGNGNGYFGQVKVWFPVVKDDIGTWTITLNRSNYIYNGRVIDPTARGISFLDSSNNPVDMQEGVDYVVDTSLSDQKNASNNQRILIKGRGKYSGENEITYTIQKKNIEDTSGGSIRVVFDGNTAAENRGEYRYTYQPNNAGVRPRVKVYYQPDGTSSSGAIELTLGTNEDYRVSYENNTEITSDAAVKIIANNRNYTGTLRMPFEITPIDLTSDIVFSIDDHSISSPSYTGEAIRPIISAKYADTGVPFSPNDTGRQEYTITYSNNYDINNYVDEQNPNASVTIRATDGGHCSGTVNLPFYIKGDLSTIDTATRASIRMVQTQESEFIYGTTADRIDVGTLIYETNPVSGSGTRITLRKGTHYTLSNVDTRIGIHHPTVKAILDQENKRNTFSGTLPRELASYKVYANLSEAEVTSNATIDFSSEEEIDLSDYLTVTCGGRRLIPNEEFVFTNIGNIHVGENTVRIVPTGTALATGILREYKDVTYNVQSLITEDCIEEIPSVYEYEFGFRVADASTLDGKIVVNGRTLVNGTDYTVTVGGNNTDVTNSGGRLIINGIGNYGGTVTKSFTITPRSITDSAIRRVVGNTASYTGNVAIPEISLTARYHSQDIELVERTDYNVSASGVERGGPYVVTIEGTGNYTGSFNRNYTIAAQSVAETDVVTYGAIQDQTYRNGKEIKPAVTVKTEMRTLREGTDYTIEYRSVGTESVNAVGSKYVLVTGSGNYSGTYRIPYNVVKKDIGDLDVTATGMTASTIYNGREQHVSFSLVYDGDTIMSYDGNSDTASSNGYMTPLPDVEFSNATNVTSSATITVTAHGANYEGTKTLSFKIKPLSITDKAKYIYYSADGEENNLKTYKLKYPYTGNTVEPDYVSSTSDKAEKIGVFYDDRDSSNNNTMLVRSQDFTVKYAYIEPDTENTAIRDEYEDDTFSNAGKVLATVTGIGNYEGTSTFTYYIGDDISDVSASLNKSSVVYNTKVQKPSVNVPTAGKYTIVYYKNKVSTANIINDPDTNFIDADTYYVRIEGVPTEGTYASKPTSLTYTITPRPLSSRIVIDGFKKEYNYTGSPIAPIGIAVTDYIDDVKYKLAETKDYNLSYTNNMNVGTATINVTGINNFQGTATARFTITSSKITSGNMDSNANIGEGIGSISSGNATILPTDVRVTLNAANGMYYTGQELKPTVTINGLTQNVGYTVTYSNNVEVGIGVITITGIGNNSGTITKYFRIIGDLAKCNVNAIPEQLYTGNAVTPSLTVTCGKNVLKQGTDYTVVYTNNVNVGTATATLRAASNPNYTGSKSVNFIISTNPSTTTATSGNNDTSNGGFYVTGYSSRYTYTGNPIRPTLVVQSGNTVLREGTDYTVTYSNNVNVGTANMTVTGIGKYAGTQNLTFEIVKKDIQSTVASGVSDKVYTGDVYTPSLTVTDGNKTLTNGVDYTVTYSNNTDPGVANITIQGMNSYTGTKVVSFKISGVAVSGLKASSVKSNSASLSWDAQEYADGYQICNKKSKVVKTVTKNRASMTGLSSGKTYKYKVRSYVNNADGTKSFGGFSPVVSLTTKLATPSVKIVSSKKGQAKISWSKVSGATGYEIYYKKSASANYKKLKTINSTTIRNCVVKGMKSGDRYYFRVRAIKKTGSSKIESAFNPLKVITIK